MNELIKITTNEKGQRLVSARELYLGVGLNKSEWSKWHKRNIIANDYFEENIDWTGFGVMTNGNETMDFAISLDFAKHIAMMARTEKSHEYRNYFIECEKVVKENLINTQQLSPELQMFNQMFKAIANNELEQKRIKASIEETKEEVQAIRDVITLDSNGWRKESTNIINAIAKKLGGFGHIQPIREESYKLLNERLGVDISKRLLNKRKNMALEGVSKSKIDKVNRLDVIAEDKKLIDGYVNIVRQFAIKYGIA